MIPKHAKRVFKGKIFDVYQWRQKMFDGSYKIFERAARQNTVIVIASVKDKIVMLKQRQPDTGWFYSTPSGRADIPGESAINTARRELLEETGMKAEKLFLWKKLATSGKVVSTLYFFIARNCKKISSQNLDSGEKIKVSLVSFETYLNLVTNPKSHMHESQLDAYRAKLDPKYKKYLKRIIFG